MTFDAAMELATRGWWVFPVQPRGKAPACPHGAKDATDDPAKLEALWRAAAPRGFVLNVGIATGQDSGLWVLDVDGEEGERSLAALVALHGELPPTVEVRTGRGRHLYFHHPGPQCDLRNSAGKVGAGLDVRADGGYVVAPPSIHPSGDAYMWHNSPAEVRLAHAPDWLLARATRPLPAAPAPSPYRPQGMFLGATQYGRKALADECSDLARQGEGGRNDALNRVAFRVGQLVKSGHLDENVAKAEVWSAAKAAGLGEREIAQTWGSGYNSGYANPAASDPDPNAQPPARVTIGGTAKPAAAVVKGETVSQAEEPEILTAGQVAERAFIYLTEAEKRSRLPRFGFPLLDEAIGGQPPGTMTVIGGSTGSGKSSLGLEVALKQAMTQSIKVGWISCEDAEWVVGARILASVDDLDPRAFFRHAPTREDMECAMRGIQTAGSIGVLCAFPVGKRIEVVMSAVHTLLSRGCTHIIVDYLQAIAARGEDRYHARTDHAQMLKGACHDAGVALTMMSQLKRHDGEPSMSDLKDSGDIENMAEAVMLLWKESDQELAPTLGKVTKVKWSASRPRFTLDRKPTGAVVGLSRRVEQQRGPERERVGWSK